MRRIFFYGYIFYAFLIVAANSEADPRGFTEDPLSTEEKFREKGRPKKKKKRKKKILTRKEI